MFFYKREGYVWEIGVEDSDYKCLGLLTANWEDLIRSRLLSLAMGCVNPFDKSFFVKAALSSCPQTACVHEEAPPVALFTSPVVVNNSTVNVSASPVVATTFTKVASGSDTFVADVRVVELAVACTSAEEKALFSSPAFSPCTTFFANDITAGNSLDRSFGEVSGNSGVMEASSDAAENETTSGQTDLVEFCLNNRLVGGMGAASASTLYHAPAASRQRVGRHTNVCRPSTARRCHRQARSRLGQLRPCRSRRHYFGKLRPRLAALLVSSLATNSMEVDVVAPTVAMMGHDEMEPMELDFEAEPMEIDEVAKFNEVDDEVSSDFMEVDEVVDVVDTTMVENEVVFAPVFVPETVYSGQVPDQVVEQAEHEALDDDAFVPGVSLEFVVVPELGENLDEEFNGSEEVGSVGFSDVTAAGEEEEASSFGHVGEEEFSVPGGEEEFSIPFVEEEEFSLLVSGEGDSHFLHFR